MYKSAFFIVVTMSSVAFLIGAVNLWMWPLSPYAAMVYVLCFCLPILCFAPSLAEYFEGSSLRQITGLIMCTGCVYTTLFLMWFIPAARQNTAQWMGEQGLEYPLKACIDREDGAAMDICCKGLSPLKRQAYQEKFAIFLSKNPEKLEACMLKTLDGQSVVANTFAKGLSEDLENRLLKVPEKELSPKENTEVCALANHLQYLNRIDGAMSSARLLRCTLNARNPVAQQCCAQALLSLAGTQEALKDTLPDPKVLATTHFRDIAPRLLRFALPSTDPTLVAHQKQLSAQWQIDPLYLKTWSTQFGCHILNSNLSDKHRLQDAVYLRMKIALKAQSCPVHDVVLSDEHINQACESLASDAEENDINILPKYDTKALCEKMRDHSIDLALSQASASMFIALFKTRHYILPQTEDAITKALLNYEHAPSQTAPEKGPVLRKKLDFNTDFSKRAIESMLHSQQLNMSVNMPRPFNVHLR